MYANLFCVYPRPAARLKIDAFWPWHRCAQIEMVDCVDDEWAKFQEGQAVGDGLNTGQVCDFACSAPVRSMEHRAAPDPRGLKISTISKSRFLNMPVDTRRVFWSLPLISYTEMKSGIVKKQLYVRSVSKETLGQYEQCRDELISKIGDTFPVVETPIKHIDTPDADHCKFIDTRSLAVGTCKKNIISPKRKKTAALSNCVALYVRYPYCGRFHETHIKVFDKGSFEATGMYDRARMVPLLKVVGDALREFYPTIDFVELDDDTASVCSKDGMNPERCVLINSGFSCNYSVDQEALSAVLRTEYSILGTFTAGYPALKCKYYYDLDLPPERQTGVVRTADNHRKPAELKTLPWYVGVSFMVFSSGECLVSGHASEVHIRFVHAFVRDLLRKHYLELVDVHGPGPRKKSGQLSPKLRIAVTREFAARHCPRTRKRALVGAGADSAAKPRPAKRRAAAPGARTILGTRPSSVPCRSEADCAAAAEFHGRFRLCDASQLPPLVEKKSHKKQPPVVPVELVEQMSRTMLCWLDARKCK